MRALHTHLPRSEAARAENRAGVLRRVVEEQAADMSVRPEDKAFIATLYKYMFVGLMLDWVKNDMKGDPQLMVDRLAQVIHGSIRVALERLRTDKPLSNEAK